MTGERTGSDKSGLRQGLGPFGKRKERGRKELWLLFCFSDSKQALFVRTQFKKITTHVCVCVYTYVCGRACDSYLVCDWVSSALATLCVT